MTAKRAFYLLIAVNVLLIAAILGAFVIANGVAGKKSKEIAVQKADIEANTETLRSLERLQTALNQNKELSEITAKVLPPNIDQAVVVSELYKFSQEANVPIKQITFSPAKAGGLVSASSLKGVSVATANIQFDKGRYDDMLDLLKKIEDNRRRMQVTTISLTPSENQAGVLDHASIALEIYLKP